ncbi:hypothetical protein [Polymorphobacter sp.]|uniref:hypothetical protein n=1 Tax=Polymorphobacter sp. TaxID=1909290 RepID=UPI003F70C140
MAAGSPLLWLACGLGVAAVGVLRQAWSRPRRHAARVALGWALLLAAVIAGGRQDGAWGISVAALATMAAAVAALALAAATAPPERRAPPRRDATTTPVADRAFGRRLVTFLLVIPGGFAAAMAVSLGAEALATMSGWAEADAIVAAVYMVPLAWAGLATALLMQADRRHQLATLLACGLVAAPLLLVGAG